MLGALVDNSSHNIPGFDFSNLGLVENCISEFLTFLRPSYITRKNAF